MKKNFPVLVGLIFLVISCSTTRKNGLSHQIPKTDSKAIPCNFNVAAYASKFNTSVLKKTSNLILISSRDTTLNSKNIFSVDTLALKMFHYYRVNALNSLYNNCGACNFFKQDSLTFVEVLTKGYCTSYTMYVLNKEKKCFGYQAICSATKCKILNDDFDSTILDFIDIKAENYNTACIKSYCLNGEDFNTYDISFLNSISFKIKAF